MSKTTLAELFAVPERTSEFLPFTHNGTNYRWGATLKKDDKKVVVAFELKGDEAKNIVVFRPGGKKPEKLGSQDFSSWSCHASPRPHGVAFVRIVLGLTNWNAAEKPVKKAIEDIHHAGMFDFGEIFHDLRMISREPNFKQNLPSNFDQTPGSSGRSIIESMTLFITKCYDLIGR